MKFFCTQENLNKALISAEKIIAKNNALPILSNILLETENGRLKISATNLEIGVSYWIGAKVEEGGSITVPAKILTSFITKLPNKKIDFETKEGDTLKIITEEVTTNIKGMDAKEFPIIPQIKEHNLAKIKNIDFKNALIATVMALAVSDVRPEIGGVFLSFDFSKELLTVVATDSFRLAEQIIDFKKTNVNFSEIVSIILPKNTTQELIKILDNAAETNITISTNQVFFTMDGINLVSRLIDGKFPDYKQIIPQSYETDVVLEIKQLINLTRIAGLFSDEHLMNIVLKTDKNNSLVIIKSESDQVGSSESKIKAKITGKDTEIVFNYKQLVEGLGAIMGEKVIFSLNGPSAPAVIKPENSKISYQYVIMPKVF